MKSVQIWNYFRSVFSCIRAEYGDLHSKHFSRSVYYKKVTQFCSDCKKKIKIFHCENTMAAEMNHIKLNKVRIFSEFKMKNLVIFD